MSKAVKKQTSVEFVKWDGTNFSEMPGWLIEAMNKNTSEEGCVYEATRPETMGVKTINGGVPIEKGNILLYDGKEIWPCVESIFKKMYEVQEPILKSHSAEFATLEFEIISKHKTDPENRPVIEEFRDEIIALVDKFGKSGQSGGSAPFTARVISEAVGRLCLQKPLSPITGIDEEWTEVSSPVEEEPVYQNNRCSAIFKQGKEGKPYYIDAIVFDGDLGGRFTGNGSLTYNGKPLGSAQYIKSFPFSPKTFYVDVIDHRWKDKEETQPDPNGDWWTHSLKDEAQLKEVFEYYDIMND